MVLIHEAILIGYTYVNDSTYYYYVLCTITLCHVYNIKVMNRLILRESDFYMREHMFIIISLMIIIKLHNVY